MIINFDNIEEQVLPNFKGGEKALNARMFTNELGKIMRSRLEKGASIGYHTHDTSSEIIYILKGTATVIYDDVKEIVNAGEVTYCPKGHSHSMTNEQDEVLEFFAVVPEQ